MKPFKPETLPLENLDWSAFIDMLGKANRYVARYDGLLQSVLNPDVLLSPLRTQEAVLSSKIEGTQATLEEVMEYEADQDAPEARKADIHEVINYRKALLAGREEMQRKPLSLGVIRQMHRLLMQDVRGQGRDPGNFRRIQNWIGTPGSTMDSARFVPPSVLDMTTALDNWERYLHSEDKDVLVQLAIVHAQFEIIHPFLDGNGRIGRILIPLFLYHKEIIRQPIFYMSEYLENNRKDYYNALKDITDHGNWTQWIRFFLHGIIVQAEKNIGKTRAIIELYDTMKRKVAEETHSQFSILCLDFIFSHPIFNSSQFYKGSGIPRASAIRNLKMMETAGIIHCTSKGAGRRPAYYSFPSLVGIINQ